MLRAKLDRASRLLWYTVAAAVLAAWLGAFGYTTLRLREQALQDGLASTQLYTTSLEDSLTQALRVLELSGHALQEQFTGDPGSVAMLNQELQSRERSMPFARSLSIADSEGRILSSSNRDNIGIRVDLSTAYPQAGPDVSMVRMGRSIPGRDWNRWPAASQQPLQEASSFVPLYLPWRTNGRVFWWVVALNFDHFQTQAKLLFNADELQAHWVRYDGTHLSSTDTTTAAPILQSRAQTLGQWMQAQDFGTHTWQDAGSAGNTVSPASSLMSYRASSQYPLAVSVWLPQRVMLDTWARESRGRALALTPLLLLLGLLGSALWIYRERLAKQQRELDQQRQLDQRVVQNASDAILVTDAQGHIQSVNPAFETLTGFKAQEVLGQNARLIGSGEHSKDFFAEIFKQVLETGTWAGELNNRHKSGHTYVARMSINAIRDTQGVLLNFAGVLSDISQQSRMQAALRDSDERMKLALEGGELAAWDWDIPSGQVIVSPYWCAMLGLAPREAVHVHEWEQRVHPQDLERVRQQLSEHLQGRSASYVSEHRLRHEQGHWLWIQDTGRVTQRDAERHALRMVGVHQDISQRKAAEEALHLAASVFSHAQEAIMITDPVGTLIDVNQAFVSITGYERHEVIGRNTSMLSSGRQGKAFYASMWASLKGDGRWTGEIWNRRKSGEVYAELLTISAVQGADGQVLRFVALFSDITRLKEHEQQLERIAHFDALTGLPNRALLSDRLQLAMAQTERRGKKLAVVFLDLDGFKAVNDNHGHAAGDMLLIALADRMKQALREGDTLARLGGDEFVAVLPDLSEFAESLPVLERLRLAAAEPVHSENHPPLQVSASLGLSFYTPHDNTTADQLMRQADQAMYQAKISGKNRYHVFDASHDQSLREQHESLDAIRQALDRREFVVHYQPKVNMRTGQVLGAEALVRWNHPTLGLLPPARILPTIQNHVLGLALGGWLLHDVLRQIALWKTQDLRLAISLNLDAQQLTSDLVPLLEQALTQHPSVEPGDLRLEVLETTALNDMDEVSDLMRRCEVLGVDFSLDDFGTGYSSLTYLRRLPARELKIDQSFVRNMLEDPDDLAILQGVLGLARAFQREVIAEGVETTAHGCALLRMGCEHAQGYAIARPLPATELLDWCRTWQPPVEWLGLPRLGSDHQLLLFALAELTHCRKGVLDATEPTVSTARSRMQCGNDFIGQWLKLLAHDHPCRTRPHWGRLQQLQQRMQQLQMPPDGTAPRTPPEQLREEWLSLNAALEETLRALIDEGL
ncbi:MAG: EAL domain-containing protein [Hydrogenophaga sp.]|uniref:bifunctional diguanylate cyclase/phosphodiesterase n=1 Tax=Hydrogenophaga sp. TaxID=1904254 RepID=UPI002AB93BE5|nr:EAL domain-containing protein [Hydrogenophaga sp.]MDZ4188713.1 EAL domain-containing protein [Hydrogenophaga sp.]